MTYKVFLEEFRRLKTSYPSKPTHSVTSIESDYGDYLYRCQNIYFSFDNAECQNSIYIFDSFKAVNCYDGDYLVKCENCYECIDIADDYNCSFLNYTFRSYDSNFCYACYDSHHLFGCAYLKFKQYCIFNVQYTEEEYQRKVKELIKLPQEKNLEKLKEIISKFPATTSVVTHSENCDYNNHVFKSKNLYLCFDSAFSENSAYLYDSHHNNNCYDFYQSHHSQFCYECVDSVSLNNCMFIKGSGRLSDSAFCEFCNDSNHLFGCYELDNKDYCILNKKYSKEEYEREVKQIMESFRQQGLN